MYICILPKLDMQQQCVETLPHGYNSAYNMFMLGLMINRKPTIYLYSIDLLFYRLDDSRLLESKFNRCG